MREMEMRGMRGKREDRESENAMLLALKTEEEATKQEMPLDEKVKKLILS